MSLNWDRIHSVNLRQIQFLILVLWRPFPYLQLAAGNLGMARALHIWHRSSISVHRVCTQFCEVSANNTCQSTKMCCVLILPIKCGRWTFGCSWVTCLGFNALPVHRGQWPVLGSHHNPLTDKWTHTEMRSDAQRHHTIDEWRLINSSPFTVEQCWFNSPKTFIRSQ